MTAHHLIIGGGPAATNAIETIREFETEPSRITLVSNEPAHSRMALPYWLAGQIPRQQTHTGDADYFQKLHVDTLFDSTVTKVEPQARRVTLDDGNTLDFDHLLIATGSSPLQPRFEGTDLPGVTPLWTLDQVQHVLDQADGLKQPRVVLVGAGFIGFIVLNAMFKRGWQLAVVEREGQVLPRMLDQAGAGLVESWLPERGVAVHTATSVQSIKQGEGTAKQVVLDNGQTLEADIVVLATGIQANTDLLQGSSIETDQGILVNDRMQTNFSRVYAGGDVAQGPVLFSERPVVHAIQTTAVDHGRVAGANMAGHTVHYPGSLLMNVVDVCGLQTASYGEWNDPQAEAMTIDNRSTRIYRKLLWRDDQLVGAIFIGKAHDLGMLNDLGMVKGILQTQTRLGPWKKHLAENPFDVRRAYIGAGVAKELVNTTLLGRPAKGRQYHFGNVRPQTPANPPHQIFVNTQQNQ